MNHPRAVAGPLTGAILLSMSAMAADPASTAAQPLRARLDLKPAPITQILTQAQIDEVLSRAVERRHIEEVEVESSRLAEPRFDGYIPTGLAAAFWAADHPTGFWKLFAPMQVQRTSTAFRFNPTHPSQSAPGIAAMSGEVHRVDR